MYMYMYISKTPTGRAPPPLSFEVIPLRKTVNLERFWRNWRDFCVLEISNYDQEDIQIAAKCSQNSPK